MEIVTRKDALERNLKTYFTGKPCKNGHITYRWSDGHCEKCHRQFGARTFQRTKDVRKVVRLAGIKRWREANPKKHAVQHNNSNILRRRLIGGQALAKTHMKEIQLFYRNCPEGCHVDHVVPILNKKVCGLHVPWNLQYLTAHENITKGNSFVEI